MPLWIATLLVILAVAGTVVATTIVTFPGQRLDLFEASFETTDFDLTEFRARIRGRNVIDITLNLTNTGSVAHEANVTVQVLDQNGDVIKEKWRLTGSVDPGSSWTSTFTFARADLVRDYKGAFVIVEQVS